VKCKLLRYEFIFVVKQKDSLFSYFPGPSPNKIGILLNPVTTDLLTQRKFNITLHKGKIFHV
jgi:hypothetical protein